MSSYWVPLPTDARDAEGRVAVVPWVEGQDGSVSLGIAGVLRDGENPSNLEVTLWKLAKTETGARVDETDLLVGAPVVVGTTVSQRMAGLEPDWTYRLQILTGADGDQRPATIVIDVAK